MRLTTSVFALALALAAGCSGGTDHPLPEEDTLDYRDCTADSDCVYVTNGCCDCANGGKDLAVNKSKVADFGAEFDCSGRCTLMGMDPPCGSGTVKCEKNLCTYTPRTN